MIAHINEHLVLVNQHLFDISWKPVLGINARINVSFCCHIIHDVPTG